MPALTEAASNPYRREIEAVLPRLLAIYDRDPTSPTFGVGDRFYWGWKLIDFPNGTHQGAVHGLARLLTRNLLPSYIAQRSIVERIDGMIDAVGRIMAPDGSLAEAFPRESSFCVTALVAYDVLCAADELKSHVDEVTTKRWTKTVEPLIDFLVRNDETHAIISNHLATGVAALMRWQGSNVEAARNRAQDLLKRISAHQSAEGWFSEYGGLDPGYETLCLAYLADVHLRNPNLGLKPQLERSLALLSHFAHPDGSFGGFYGSRNTRFIVPGGLEELAAEHAPAAALARFSRAAIANRTCVTLSTLDDGNLVPMFNSYCRAATAVHPATDTTPSALPCEDKSVWRRHLTDADIFIDNGPKHYTIVALGKGGAVQHYMKDEHTADLFNPGALGRRGQRFYSTQAQRKGNRVEIGADRLIVEAPFIESKSERPTPFKFIVLRTLSLTLFRWRPALEWVKRRLVERLITGQKQMGVSNQRTIVLGPDLRIEDRMLGSGLEPVKSKSHFYAIHMASAGYWQRQDDTI